jgi:hypothetical protein
MSVLNCMADGDASTWYFAEFSSKWRTHFSHLRGGSYNRTVVQFCSMEVHVAIGEGKYSWGE